MADWSLPTLSSGYANFLSYLSGRDEDAASLGYGSITNPFTGQMKYVRASNKFQEWDGAAWQDKTLSIAGGGTGSSTAANARTALGLGTIATQDSNNVTITGGTISGLGSLAVSGNSAIGGDETITGLLKTGSTPVTLTNAAGKIVGLDSTRLASLDGSALTGLNASVLASGTVPEARLSDAYLVPLGAILEYAGAVAPSANFKICDGSAISRVTYATLFALLGTTWGAGNGSTTFNIPDKRGRTGIGAGTGSGLSARTLAATVGEETHQLTTPELASHSHNLDGTHHHQVLVGTGSGIGQDAILYGASGGAAYQDLNDRSTQLIKDPDSGATLSAGGDGAHNNMQPSLVFNYIIRVL